MKLLRTIILMIGIPLAACSSLRTPLPLTEGAPPVPLSSSVFAGHARAMRFADGNWQPLPAFDYDFLVLERRYADRWEAVKEIHYRHPKYDGRAGKRDQTHYFLVRTAPAGDGGLDLAVSGTLGTGRGHEGKDGLVVIELTPAARGWFVPYDTVRISQTRAAASGRVEEVVELFTRKEGGEMPFMRMLEEGTVYRPAAH